MNENLPKYGILALGLFLYLTSPERTTKNLGGFIILAGLLFLFVKRGCMSFLTTTGGA